mgnify:CR=1 FL=1
MVLLLPVVLAAAALAAGAAGGLADIAASDPRVQWSGGRTLALGPAVAVDFENTRMRSVHS